MFLSLFILFFLTTFASFFITKYKFKKGLIETEIFSSEPILSDTPASLSLKFATPYSFLPCRLSLRLKLIASHKRRILETNSISPGRRENLNINISPAKRGEYKGDLSLLLCDPFSLFRGVIRINKETSLLVLSTQTTPEETLRPLKIHSNISSQKKENSDDLYEVRKYYPGDDPRKINWKMFSHSGELFLRMGESGTPQKKRIFTSLLLDSKINPSLLGAYYDQLIKTFLGFLTIFKEDGKEIFSILPGETQWKRIELLSEYTHSLSSQNLTKKTQVTSFTLPEKEDEFFILAPPDSSVLSPLLSKIEKEGHSCHLFIKNYKTTSPSTISAKTSSLCKSLFIKKESLSFFSQAKLYFLEGRYLKKLNILDKEKKRSIRRGYVKNI